MVVLSGSLAQYVPIFWSFDYRIFPADIYRFLMPSALTCVDNRIAERTKVSFCPLLSGKSPLRGLAKPAKVVGSRKIACQLSTALYLDDLEGQARQINGSTFCDRTSARYRS